MRLTNTHRSGAAVHGAGGFTLLEVLVSLAILAVGLLGLLPLTWSASQANATARHFTEAHALAQAKLEKLKLFRSYSVAEDYTLLDNIENLIKDLEIENQDMGNALNSGPAAADYIETGLDATGVAAPGGIYTRYWNVVDDTADNTGTARPFFKAVRVAVTWQENGQTREVSYTSLIGVKELAYY